MEEFSQFLLYILYICWLENKVWHLLYIVNILGITCSFLWISIVGCFCYLSRVYANVIHLYFLFSSSCCTKSALNQQIFISLIESTHDCNANILQKCFFDMTTTCTYLGYSLYMWAAGFEVFPFQIIKHISRFNVIWRTGNDPIGTVLNFFPIYRSVAFHKYPTRENSNQSRVVQVNCIRLPARVQSHTKGLILLRAPIPANTFTQCESQK